MTQPAVVVYRIDDRIIRDLDRELRALGRTGMQGIVRARNRTAQFVRTQGQRTVRKRLALPAAYVRDRILIRQATLEDQTASVRVPRRQTRFDRFRFRELTKAVPGGGRRGAGIAITLHPGEREVLPSAFTVPLRRGRDEGGGGTGIAIRTEVLRRLGSAVDGSATGGAGRRRYEVLHTSSIRDVFSDGYQTEIGPKAAAIYQQQTERELANAIRRTRGSR